MFVDDRTKRLRIALSQAGQNVSVELGHGPHGMVLHFVNGTLIFPAIYAYALTGILPGPPAIKGAIWGIVLWILAQVVVMPMMGGGLFSSAMEGTVAVMGSLIGHLLYGSLLGAIAGAPEAWVAHA